jgi:hypothetical protein
VPPTATAVPPTNTPETPPGGSICVNAFADADGNGARDAAEGYMGNVTFTVANGAQVVGQALSTGTDQPFCFEGLEPGPYQVAQLLPGPLEMTTASNATVNVVEGSSVGVEFGSRLRQDSGQEVASTDVEPTAVSVDTEAPAEETSPVASGLGSITGLLVLIGAVVLLGVLLFFVLRRQAS